MSIVLQDFTHFTKENNEGSGRTSMSIEPFCCGAGPSLQCLPPHSENLLSPELPEPGPGHLPCAIPREKQCPNFTLQVEA